MIRESVQFLADEVNNYFDLKLGLSGEAPRIALGNAAKAFDVEGTPPLNYISITNKGILTLVNVEEDRIAKRHENYEKTATTTRYKSPPLYLNLYLLFSLNRNSYADSLAWLGHILQFFQHQKVFTPFTHPALNPKIKELIVDMYSLTFEQVNHLWSTLGGKYMPSVMYRVRQITLDEDITTSETGLIKEIQLTEKVKQPVTI